MYNLARPGTIEVIAGVMFSGKSEELIRRVRRALIARRQVQVFKPHLDERYAGVYRVSSHSGLEFEAVPVDSAAEIMRLTRPDTELVAIDEAQFLDQSLTTVATALAGRGVRGIVARPGPRCRGRAVRRDGRPHGDRRAGGQAERDLRGLRRPRLPEPAPGEREAGPLRLPHHSGGRQRGIRGAVPAASHGAQRG